MIHLVVDASVVLGLLNTSDKYHKVCKDFWDNFNSSHENNKDIKLIFPSVLHFEVNRRIRTKKRNKEWGKSLASFTKYGGFGYPIDSNLRRKVTPDIIDKFDKLSAMDSIYAIIAYLEKWPLVTTDSGFQKVKEHIDIYDLASCDINTIFK